MPPLDHFRLTKELVQQRVKDNIIIVTFGNYAFMDFILTWAKHLSDLQVSNFLVGAMDTKLLEALYWKGVPVFDMGSHMSTVDVGWGSPTFHKMGREKVILIDSILPYGFELLMCDTDMVWLKNPLPYLARYPEADVLTSSDQVVPTVVDDSLDRWQQVPLSSYKLESEFNLLTCGVLYVWKLLDFAELKRSSISFFDIEKHETAVSRWSRARTRAAKVGKGLSKDEKARKLALQHWLEAALALARKYSCCWLCYWGYNIGKSSLALFLILFWEKIGAELSIEELGKRDVEFFLFANQQCGEVSCLEGLWKIAIDPRPVYLFL
ncbi:hypothetical protein F8388_023540 [Cannabis sativa]|uniref:Nucleotide-diphospho-sugar transferase domain-containing protein n=1 Tax=Cannabis sativa TaxID=3483 RepID=A0A7J6EG65_CANSA|nr:hypothetical protein F8388_023540 [Cannabis sativa]